MGLKQAVGYRRGLRGSTALLSAIVAALAACGGADSDGSATGSTTANFIKLADEGQTFSIAGLKNVRYGSSGNWSQKLVSGRGMCTDGFFGRKGKSHGENECYVDVASLTAPGPSPAPSTGTTAPVAPAPVVDSGPVATLPVAPPIVTPDSPIAPAAPAAPVPPAAPVAPASPVITAASALLDASKIPASYVGYGNDRVRTVWYDPTNNNAPNPACTAVGPTCQVPPAYQIGYGSDIGAFRLGCAFSHMNFDDSIVSPGSQNVAHLHTYFGNTGANAFSTADSLLKSGNGSCEGGTVNRSAYWVPSMIDTLDGRPIAPSSNVVYYKGDYRYDISPYVQPIPTGLRMVSGNSKNTNPAAGGAGFTCLGAAGNGPTARTIAGAMVGGKCIAGNELLMSVNYPNCWDGKNLDSPDHISHMSSPESYLNTATSPWSYPWRCPSTHPVVLPNVSFNVHYPITDNAQVARWRLSSDLMVDPSLPAGITGHGDVFFAWNPEFMKTFVQNCIKVKSDCHASLLGDMRTLY
jgi:hypothetical protein